MSLVAGRDKKLKIRGTTNVGEIAMKVHEGGWRGTVGGWSVTWRRMPSSRVYVILYNIFDILF